MRDENARIRRLKEMDKSGLPPDGGPRFNRLIFAGSPYLLQHAENPVDWYPWGNEAFDKAKEEDKPVFLSIGYATCHWCHVMAHESFEDRDVAEVLNRYFVPIKVDREERPDVDEQYMTAAHLMNVSGGWPLTVLMNHDRRPFFIATYLPKSPRQGMAGIIELLQKIAEVWRTRRADVEKQGAAVIAALAKLLSPAAGELSADGALFETAYRQLASIYDPGQGGFGNAPKFPMPLYLSFLVRYGRQKSSQEALTMTDHTLRAMRAGGIYDQIGYGFHRYSVDKVWLVPHFEKMLYDQALLAMAYLDAYQAMKNGFFSAVAGEIFNYVKREMTSEDGGFYSALDADSEGEEGTYYLWTPSEVAAILGPEPARRFCRLFGITEQGNFEGRNIPSLPLSLSEFAVQEGMPVEELSAEMERSRGLLLNQREQRIKPLRDEKILTAWNGLMIAALARGYAMTGEQGYRSSASGAASFIRKNLTTAAGRLLRSRHAKQDGIPGFLEDYAFFCWGLIELYQATLETDYLESAIHYTGDMLKLFRDPDQGGFFDTGRDMEPVLVRTRGGNDGVIPSASSVAAMNLLRLGRITGDGVLLGEGERALQSGMGNAARHPANHLTFLIALDYVTRTPVEITLSGGQTPDQDVMLQAIGRRTIPGLVVRHAIKVEEYPAIEGRVTVYPCAAGSCRPPLTTVAALEAFLDEFEGL